ncbi:hypothetical protein [Aeoliella sp.]|uniref:hypothetical protein n=1 Tax=Aeoliella sp. TaxID=2795800 RepID=UPI003CCC2071
MATEKRQRESAWLTVAQLADALDVSQHFVREEVLRCTPSDAKKKEGGRWLVHGRTAIEGYLLDQLRRRLPANEPIEDPVFLME